MARQRRRPSARAASSFSTRTPLPVSSPLRVEVLAGRDAFVADADERGGELAIVGANLALRGPSSWRCGTPSALLRVRRSGAPRRSARVRRSARSGPSSRAPATACSRRGDRGCGGFPAPGRGSRRRLRALRASASLMASSVISWKTMRRTRTFGFRTCFRCQLIDSPSRSGSVARMTSDASLSADFSCWTYFFLSAGTT